MVTPRWGRCLKLGNRQVVFTLVREPGAATSGSSLKAIPHAADVQQARTSQVGSGL
jgi:hypothetical protein